MKVHKNEKILVIADGAAFGSEMDRVMRLMESRKNIVLYLPESCCDGEDFEESI